LFSFAFFSRAKAKSKNKKQKTKKAQTNFNQFDPTHAFSSSSSRGFRVFFSHAGAITFPHDDKVPYVGCRVTGCSMGGLIADALAHTQRTDIGFANGGAIRGGIDGSTITSGEIVTALPFLNNAAVVSGATGETVRKILENSISKLGGPNAIEDPDGRFLQVSYVK
jgi:hypothetical protein